MGHKAPARTGQGQPLHRYTGGQKPGGDGGEGGSGEDSGSGEQPPAGEDGEGSGDGSGDDEPGSDNPSNGSSDGNQTTPPQGDSDSGEGAGEGGESRPGASEDADTSRAEEDGGKLAATGDALSLPMIVAAAGSALAFAGAAIAARIRRKRD